MATKIGMGEISSTLTRVERSPVTQMLAPPSISLATTAEALSLRRPNIRGRQRMWMTEPQALKVAWLTVRSDRSARLVVAEVGKGERVMVSKMVPCGVMLHESVLSGRGGGLAGGRQCGSGPGGGTGTTLSSE